MSVWVVGWRPDRRHVWGARALSLSQWGRDGYVARPPAVLAPELAGVAHAAPPALTSCSVCLEDFESDLPHPDRCSPSQPTRALGVPHPAFSALCVPGVRRAYSSARE